MEKKVLGYVLQIKGTDEEISKLTELKKIQIEVTAAFNKFKQSIGGKMDMHGITVPIEQQRKYAEELAKGETALKAANQELNKHQGILNKTNTTIVFAADSYRGLTEENKKLKQQYDILSPSIPDQAAKMRDLSARINTNTESLSVMDLTMGRHNRNVGNYSGSILTATRGLRGFSEIGRIVAQALGLNTEALETAVHTFRAGSVAIRGMQEAMHATKASQEAGTVATGAQTIAQRVYNFVIGESVGAMKLFRIALAATGIGAIIFLLIEGAKMMWSFGDSTEKASESAKKLKEQQKELNKTLQDTADIEEEIEIQRFKNSGKINERGEKSLNIDIDINKKRIAAQEAFDAATLELIDETEDERLKRHDILLMQLDQLDIEREKRKKILALKGTGEDKEIRDKNAQQEKEDIKKTQDEIEKLKAKNDIEKLRVQFEIDKREIINSKKTEETKKTLILLLIEKFNLEKSAINKKASEGAQKQIEENNKKIFDLSRGNIKSLIDLEEDGTEKKVHQFQFEQESKRILLQRELEDTKLTGKDKIELEKKINEAIQINIRATIEGSRQIQEEGDKKELEEIKKSNEDKIKEERREADELMKMNADNEELTRKVLKEDADKEKEIQEKIDKEKKKNEELILNATIDNVNKIQDAIFEAQNRNLDRQHEARNAALEAQKTLEEKRIDDQVEQGIITQAQADIRREALAKKFAAQELALKKQAFEEEKKLKLKQLAIEQATAIAIIWAKLLAAWAGIPILGQAIAITQAGIETAILVASTAVQAGIIASQKFARGGAVLRGRSHAQGGIPIEAEGDEIIMTKGVYRNPALRQYASAINQAGGGVAFANGGVPVPSAPNNLLSSMALNGLIDMDAFTQKLGAVINDKKVFIVEKEMTGAQRKAQVFENSRNF